MMWRAGGTVGYFAQERSGIGIAFDRPDVASTVKADIADDRTRVIGGDFFVALPAADLCLRKCVLHHWDDESCVQILSRCGRRWFLAAGSPSSS